MRVPSKTSFVEMTASWTPRAAHASAIRPVAVPFRRIASAGSLAQPSTSVQAAAWMTTSGRSRAISASTEAAVSVSRSRSGRDQAIGPIGPVNGASSSAAISARPRRPCAPVTATRIGQPASLTACPAASRSPYWRW